MSQLAKLTEPFHQRFVRQKGGSFRADYVPHSTVTEFLLGIVGPYTFEHVCWLHNCQGELEGGIFRLTVEIDGKTVSIEEAGAIERPVDNMGERAKDIASDAIKRCSMRIGLGLHLWSQESYILHSVLAKREKENKDG